LVPIKLVILNSPNETSDTLLFLHKREKRQTEGGLRTKVYLKESYPDKPLVSIITVVYNGEKYLNETIQSILNQTYDNIEYIIIDGGSTDGTLDIIKKYNNAIDYWISENDNGIYDAMNKGLRECTGEYVWFINAGDRIFQADTTENMINICHDADVFYGNTQLVDKSGSNFKLLKAPEHLTWKSFLHGMVVSHQSIVIKRNLCQPYDLQYKYVSDHDWIVNALKKANKTVNVKITLSKYLLDGFSQQNFQGCWQEKFKIVKKYHGVFGLLLNYHYYGIAKIKNAIKSKIRKR
jgi:glycosyltransferase involved in cell wall biosynthesis